MASMRSGFPCGWTSGAQARKRGLRTRTIRLPGTYDSILYGPVPGAARTPVGRLPTDEGRIQANDSASFAVNSGSARVRWNMTVPRASSVTIPSASSQRRGLHLSAPRIAE
jgi:hypothetical protein